MSAAVSTAIPRRRRHGVHRSNVNSRRALREGRHATGFSQRATKIREWLAANGPTTDRRIMEGLGFTDMNAVRPRVTELLDLGLLQLHGSTNDHRTGKTVRLVWVTEKAEAGMQKSEGVRG